MNGIVFANAGALGAPQVIFVSLAAVVTLLCLRALTRVMRLALSRSVSQVLDGSIVVLFLLFIVLIIVRFTTIG